MHTYNIPDRVKGTTFKGIQFTLKNSVTNAPLNLTDTQVKLQFRRGSEIGLVKKELALGTGITLTNAVGGVLVLDPFLVTWDAGLYYYDLKITHPTNVIDVYINGTFRVLQNVTD